MEDVNVKGAQINKCQCLFCLEILPLEYMRIKQLDNVLDSGQILSIPLNDPVKNSQAFDLLCTLLNVNWEKCKEGGYFDPSRSLPLCVKCQTLYQDLNQVHHQIRELEAILKTQVKVIRAKIEAAETGDNTNENERKRQFQMRRNARAQVELLGLHVFRRKVLDAAVLESTTADASKLNASDAISQLVKKANCTSNYSLVDDHPSKQTVKQEEIECEQNLDDSLEECTAEDILERDSYHHLSEDDDTYNTSSVVKREMEDCSNAAESDDSCESVEEVIRKSSTRSRRNLGGNEIFEAPKTTQDEDEENRSSDGDSDFQVKSVTRKKKATKTPHVKDPSSKIRSKDTCKTHKQTSQDPSRYKCSQCPQTFVRQYSLKCHMLTHEDPSTLQLYVCNVCFKAFKHHCSFNKHKRNAHDGQAECTKRQVHDGPLECTNVTNPTKEALDPVVGATTSVPYNLLRKCHLCLSSFASRIFLMQHIHDSHPEHKGGLTTCRCGKTFKNYSQCLDHAIRMHMKDQVEKMVQCDQCPSRFHSPGELSIHARWHVPLEERKKKYVCPVCGVGCSNPGNLSSHITRFHDEMAGPHVCDLCGKQYATKKSLHFHQKVVHQNCRPHECQHCQRKFPLPCMLSRHLKMIHMKEKVKPNCELCGKQVSSLGYLARHRREVHNDHSCPVKKRKKSTSNLRKSGLGGMVMVGPNEEANVKVSKEQLLRTPTFYKSETESIPLDCQNPSQNCNLADANSSGCSVGGFMSEGGAGH